PGTPSRRPRRAPGTIEQRGGIEAYVDAAAQLMAPRGLLVVCEQANQRVRVARAAEMAGVAITRRMDVVPREGKPALFTVFALRRSAPDGMGEDPPLVVRDRHGGRTPAFVALRADAGMPP